MRLTELEPKFIRYESHIETWNVVDGDHATWRELSCPTKDVTGPREHKVPVATLGEAQGITFLCPKCFVPGGVGVHLCEVTFEGRGVPAWIGSHNKKGEPVRWNVAGNGFDDLTTTPSILIEGGCGWHGWIGDGEVT